jgi:iron-sulfur cluster assembly protein
MLAVTQDAATVIRGLVQAAELPDDSGLRITVEEAGEGQVGLGLDVVPEPEDGDEVVAELGAQVFLEPDAANLLDDKVLDATLAGDKISFAISERGDEGPSLSGNSAGPE